MLDLASGPTIAVSSFHLARSALPRRPSVPGSPAGRSPSAREPNLRVVLTAADGWALAEHLDADQKEAADRIRSMLASQGTLSLQMPRSEGLTLAMRLHREARFPPAERFYRAVLDSAPADANARHYLGLLLHQTGRRAEGLRLVDLSLKPLAREPWAWNNLGNLHKTDGDDEAAATAYRRALALDPDFVEALNNLGIVCRAENHWQEAERHYKRAIALRPGFAAAHINLGNLYVARRQFDAAVENLSRAVELDPLAASGAFWFLARAYVVRGDFERAADIYRRWSEQEPDNPVPLHHLRACLGESPEARASDAYVSTSFDAFAENFEQHLGRLDYRAPELVAAALDAVRGAQGSLGEAADLGCGTGLCAPFLEGRASRLVGVDLSAGMLGKARERGAYDELVRAELTAYLEANRERFDTLLSADTLCYFGPLDEFARAAFAALTPGGVLVFTVEREEGGEPYRLQPSGRYSHSRVAVEASLTRAGFTVVAIADDTLRQEAGEPVHGLVVTAQRPAGAIVT